jgi:catechol O-methyltransferase
MDFSSDEDNSQESQKRPISCGVLCFHNGTEEALLIYVRNNAIPGDSASILRAIDTFCYKRHWMMHIGPEKCSVLEDAVKSVVDHDKGEIVTELGSYCGYSSICIAQHLSEKGRLFAFEINTKSIEWTKKLLEFANLAHKVILIESSPNILLLEKAIQQHTKRTDSSVDLLFIDHNKSLYLTDLKIFLDHKLLRTGSIVVADNVGFGHRQADYLDFVQNKEADRYFASSKTIHSFIEYSIQPATAGAGTEILTIEESCKFSIDDLRDAIEVSVVK